MAEIISSTTEAFWYRIRYSANGEVESCTQVESISPNGSHVFYVQALNKSDALLAANYRWNSFLESQRTRLRKRRAEHVKSGKCRCGRPIDRKGKQCSTCRESSEASHERKAAKDRGEPVVTISKSVAFASNKADSLLAVRLETLLECQRMLLKSQNFATWLEKEIRILKNRSR